LVSTWRPTKTGIYCTAHDEHFPKGRDCQICAIEKPAPAALESAPDPAIAGLPSAADHERAFLAVAETAERWAHDVVNAGPEGDDEGEMPRPSHGTAAKLLDCAIKARRAACELTRWREDWARTKETERQAALLRQRGPSRVDEDAEARH
jgi:hypothetical protein